MDNKIKNRIIFIYSIRDYSIEILNDEDLFVYLESYINDNMDKYEMLNLISNFDFDENGNMFLNDDTNDLYELGLYLNTIVNPEKLYEEVGFDTANILGELAVDFCEYYKRFQEVSIIKQ